MSKKLKIMKICKETFSFDITISKYSDTEEQYKYI